MDVRDPSRLLFTENAGLIATWKLRSVKGFRVASGGGYGIICDEEG